MGGWGYVGGVIVGVSTVSTSVVVLSYLTRLFAALVITGATKFGSLGPDLSSGGSSKGFRSLHMAVQSTSALCLRATLVSQSAI
jgi:hypothetical protein